MEIKKSSVDGAMLVRLAGQLVVYMIASNLLMVLGDIDHYSIRGQLRGNVGAFLLSMLRISVLYSEFGGPLGTLLESSTSMTRKENFLYGIKIGAFDVVLAVLSVWLFDKVMRLKWYYTLLVWLAISHFAVWAFAEWLTPPAKQQSELFPNANSKQQEQSRGGKEGFKAILDKVPDVEPDEHDRF